jgi:hypothetical protein
MNPWKASGTSMDYIRSYVFREMFAAPTLNPIHTNLVSTLRHIPFWRDLDDALQEIDPQLAARVTASIMY